MGFGVDAIEPKSRLNQWIQTETHKYIKYKSTLFSLLIKRQSIMIFIIADLSIIILVQRLNDRL